MRHQTLTVIVVLVAILLAGQRPSFGRAQTQDGAAGIYVVNADGAGLTLISDTGGWDLAWSPDGARIAFASESPGN